MKDRFYLACSRETVGTNMSFHCWNGNGYSTNLDKAHIYTREEAQHAWNCGREIDFPATFHEQRSLTERIYREQGIDTQKLLGHRSREMTDKYNDDRGKDWAVIDVKTG